MVGHWGKKVVYKRINIEQLGGRQKSESYLPQQEVYNHSVHAYSTMQLLAMIVNVIM